MRLFVGVHGLFLGALSNSKDINPRWNDGRFSIISDLRYFQGRARPDFALLRTDIAHPTSQVLQLTLFVYDSSMQLDNAT